MKRLLASIHDVTPRFESAIDALSHALCRRLDGPHFAMLVVPDHWGEAPLSRAPAFRARLREWSDLGVEMFLHGWSHLDDGTKHRWRDAAKARWMTAREGEFLGLDRTEAARRMREGRAIVEDAIGRTVAGFIAPAWLYGDGARAALVDEGFAVAEDHFRVWRPTDGEILSRGPVITWASRSGPRRLSSTAFAALARRASGPLRTVRIAVHPGDTTSPALLTSIDRTLSALLRLRSPARYADLFPFPEGRLASVHANAAGTPPSGAIGHPGAAHVPG